MQWVDKRKADYQEQLAIAKATIYKGLDPVDLRRCQAEAFKHEPFRIGSPARKERCDRVPTTVAIEANKAADGTRGAMALCRSCAKECVRKYPDHFYEPAAAFKAAFALGGHQAVRDMIYGYDQRRAERKRKRRWRPPVA